MASLHGTQAVANRPRSEGFSSAFQLIRASVLVISAPQCPAFISKGSVFLSEGGGLSMLRQRYLWPITIGPYLGEVTRSTSPLTEGSRVGYVQILEEGSLVWHKCGNWSRWTIFLTRGRADSRVEIHRRSGSWPKRPASVRSRVTVHRESYKVSELRVGEDWRGSYWA